MLLNGNFDNSEPSWEINKPHQYFEKTINGLRYKIDKTILFGAGNEPTDEEIEKCFNFSIKEV